MKDFGRIQSTRCPDDEIVIDDYSVWIASDIEQISVADEDGEFICYEYNLIQYSKDEYIKYITQKQSEEINNIETVIVEICDSIDDISDETKKKANQLFSIDEKE